MAIRLDPVDNIIVPLNRNTVWNFFPPCTLKETLLLESDLEQRGISLQKKLYIRNLIERCLSYGACGAIASLALFSKRVHIENFDSRIECKYLQAKDCNELSSPIVGVHIFFLSFFILYAYTNNRHLKELIIQSEDSQTNTTIIKRHELDRTWTRNFMFLPWYAMSLLIWHSKDLNKPGTSLAQQLYIHNLIDLFHDRALPGFISMLTCVFVVHSMKDVISKQEDTLKDLIGVVICTAGATWHILRKMDNLRALKEVQCKIINFQKGIDRKNASTQTE